MIKDVRHPVRLLVGASMLVGLFSLPGCSDTAEFASSPKAKATKDDIQKTEFEKRQSRKAQQRGTLRKGPLTIRANDREAAPPYRCVRGLRLPRPRISGTAGERKDCHRNTRADRLEGLHTFVLRPASPFFFQSISATLLRENRS